MNSNQIEMESIDDIISADHTYRKFHKLRSFSFAEKKLKQIEKENNYKGYGILKLFKFLLLQFIEDLSDRELERYLQENNAAKWFCDFGLTEPTPDYSVFNRARDRIGTTSPSQLFSNLRDELCAQGYMNEVFSFVDSSQLIAKANLLKERDKAIAEKYEKLKMKYYLK